VTNREADVLDKARAIAYLPVEYPQTTLGDRLRELRDLVREMDSQETMRDKGEAA
jgi:hypothetical protein